MFSPLDVSVIRSRKFQCSYYASKESMWSTSGIIAGEVMDDYKRANLALWNEWTEIHAKSEFYDLEGFKAGNTSLNAFEIEEMGEVTGKSLLHLQCHFGDNIVIIVY